MGIKVYCDKCGKEIKITLFNGLGKEHLESIQINDEKWFLCPKHYNEFVKWIRN